MCIILVKVLQICSSLDGGGGVQTVLKNYYSYIDKNEFRFDFIVHGDKIGELEPWFKGYGSKIFHITPRSRNPIKNILEIASIIKKGNYDVVHCHQDYHGAIAMLLSKHYGVKKRIIHCHIALLHEKKYKEILRYIGAFIVKKTATNLMACGLQAGEWLYGKKAISQNNVIILNNAIQIDKYLYSLEKREKIRRQFSLEDAIVIGHVGRFTYQKNHALLIDIFYEFLKENPSAVLILIGDGELRDAVEKKIKSLGIQDKVRLLGVRNDVPDLLNAMDVFVLTSRNEGLGIVVIESQANGLPIVCSGYVPKEVAITDGVFFVEKGKYTDVSQWLAEINKALKKGRSKNILALKKAGYDIKIEAKKLEAIYKGNEG